MCHGGIFSYSECLVGQFDCPALAIAQLPKQRVGNGVAGDGASEGGEDGRIMAGALLILPNHMTSAVTMSCVSYHNTST